MNRHHIMVYVLLFVIVLIGAWFRFVGISSNHSFWSDEAFVATLARDVLQTKRTLSEVFALYNYQRLHLLTTLVSMKMFGFSEFAARAPAAVMGTLGIVAAYALATKLSNRFGGLLAAFVYAFSQLNLAHATQAKSYAALETIFLLVLYAMRNLQKGNKHNLLIHITIIILASLATLFHFLGILIWIPYVIYLMLTYRSVYMLPGLILIVLLGYLFQIDKILVSFFKGTSTHTFLFQFNNITNFRELLWNNYAFITLPAVAGMLIGVYEKKYTWSISLIFFLLFYSYLWTFKQYSHNVRYLVPFMGILFVYFGVFWSKVGEKLLTKWQCAFVMLLVVLLYLGGDKIARKPQTYYSPNADIYGDVQIADYKTFFAKLDKKYPDLEGIAVFTDWGDAQRWYLPQKKVDAYFLKGGYAKHPQQNSIDGAITYGTLTQFLEEKEKYRKGLLIVEDWESLLPEEIKQYAKKNLQLEFRVESLAATAAIAADDKWPLELYSWGMEL